MLGEGELWEDTRQMIQKKQLQEYITLAGTRKPTEVRELMEKAPIFLMTSDRQEGWGAVMNEAMNSGCAVLANKMVGAAPFLINHGKNGYLYGKGEGKELAGLIQPLLDDRILCKEIGVQAYMTIQEEWNARIGARRLLSMCHDLAAGREPEADWTSGPCSKADILKER